MPYVAASKLQSPNGSVVFLTRQFRLPSYLNGNETGMMIEVCAGLLDEDHPEQCIIRETEEETGYRISKVKKVMEKVNTLQRKGHSILIFPEGGRSRLGESKRGLLSS